MVSLTTLLTMVVGCASTSAKHAAGKSKYETVASDPRRNSDVAGQKNAEAMQLMNAGDYAGAEAALKSALAADVMHGPAHNNLGKVYYHQGKLYLAAWEFQYAAKLMPGVPEPRNNLGLVFESAGKLDDAVNSYGEAMNLAPDDAQFIGNLARARVRRGDRDGSMRELLERLVMRETRPDWADWARGKLAGMGAQGTDSKEIAR
jgi:Flp pilus assembly protein TadD